MVSILCDPAVVSKMLKAGVDAFINKDTGKTELLKAIEKVQHTKNILARKFQMIYSGIWATGM